MNLDAARDALLADARADAQLLLERADRESDEQLARARDQAKAMIDAARAEGAREASDRLALEQAATRREARHVVLAARREALDELHVQARDAARRLATGRHYPELVRHLHDLATAQLGSGATITTDPDGEPGVVAADRQRRVDYRLATLADRAIDALGTEVAALWT